MNYFRKLLFRMKTSLIAELKKGVTPRKLGQSIGLGIVLGIFPVLGTTTVLCGFVAMIFRLNQVAIQSINYVIYPIQIAMLIPFYRFGEKIFGIKPIDLNLSNILNQFQGDFWGATQEYTSTGLRGIVAWAMMAPILYFITSSFSERLFKSFYSSRTKE